MAEGHSIEYREIDGFPGYRVGNDGSVWSCWKNVYSDSGQGRTGREQSSVWSQMKPFNRNGYLAIALNRSGQGQKSIGVHRLVLTAFRGPCPEGMQSRHLNSVKTDNRLENLVWGTGAENRNDIYEAGTYSKGETHHTAKLTEAEVLEIRRRQKLGESQASLARAFGVTPLNVSWIVRRKTWRHLQERG